MKRKLLSIILAFVLCAMSSVSVLAFEQLPFSNTCGVFEEKNMSSMWVGDELQLDSQKYTYEIIEGDECVRLGTHELYGYTLYFIGAGSAKVKVSTIADNSEKVYEFNILEAEESYIEYLIPKNIKIGYRIGKRDTNNYLKNASLYTYHNCLLNYDYAMSDLTWEMFDDYFYVGTNWGGAYATDPNTRTVDGFRPGCATKPGVFYIAAKANENTPYAVTIEEPVIKSNIPEKILIGTELEIKTSLENTLLENMKVEAVEENSEYPIGYQPRIEILSGAELIERGNSDYTNILSSVETMKFIGVGTVTFKVVYDMLPIMETEISYLEEEAMYSPEEIFTVEIIKEIQEPVGPEKPAEPSKPEEHKHEFKDYINNNNASMLQNGTETGKCICGEIDTREIPNSKIPVKEMEKEIMDSGVIGKGTASTQTNTDKELSKMKVENLSIDLVKDLLTEQELKAVEAGKEVSVYLDIRKLDENESKEDKKIMSELVAEKLTEGKVGMFMDLSLFKQIGDNSANKVADTKGNTISISLDIPEELKNTDENMKRTFYIVRVHEGKAEVITTGTVENMITFETDRFSTYAIVYSDTVTTVSSETTEQQSSTEATGTVEKASITESPKTGEAGKYVTLLILLAGSVGLFMMAKKKRNY